MCMYQRTAAKYVKKNIKLNGRTGAGNGILFPAVLRGRVGGVHIGEMLRMQLAWGKSADKISR